MITTNTGAKKLESSDNWREIFPNPGTSAAGAHNASVDAHDRIQAEVAPIINGKRCSLGAASGEYVLLRNSTITGKTDGAYVAAKAIPANTDLDSTYLGSPITGGIVNELNGNLANKVDKDSEAHLLSIELSPNSSMANNGGFIDFHYNGSSLDYTSRIIEASPGNVVINGISIPGLIPNPSCPTVTDADNANVGASFIQGGQLHNPFPYVTTLYTFDIGASYRQQFAIGTDRRLATRFRDSGTWSAWEEFAPKNIVVCEQVSMTFSNGSADVQFIGYTPVFACLDVNWHIQIDMYYAPAQTYSFRARNRFDDTSISDGTYSISVVKVLNGL